MKLVCNLIIFIVILTLTSCAQKDSDGSKLVSGGSEGAASTNLNEVSGNPSPPSPPPPTPFSLLTVPIENEFINLNDDSATYPVSGDCYGEGRTVSIFINSNPASSPVGFICSSGNFTGTIDVTGLSEGTLSFHSSILDDDSNPVVSDSFNVEKDITAPTINLTNPPHNSKITSLNDSATFTIDGTCSENSQTVNIQINDSDANGQIGFNCDGSNFTGTIDTTGEPDSSLSFTAIIVDTAGNSTSSAINVIQKDAFAPVVAITSPIDSGSINQGSNSATYSVTGTCNKNADPVSITVNSNPAANPVGFICDGSSFAGTIDVTGLAEGPLVFKASMQDIDNNLFESSDINVTKDTTAPSFVYDPTGVVNLANKNNYVISGTCSEDGATLTINLGGVVNNPSCSGGIWTTNSWDVSAVSDGAGQVITGSIMDAAGNSSTPLNSSTTKDTIIPTVSITSYPDITAANETNYTLVGTCSENGNTVDIMVGTLSFSTTCSSEAWISNGNDVSSLPDNANTLVTADISDNVNNDAIQATQTVDKTTSVPLVSILSSPDIDQSNQTAYTVSGGCSENGRIVDVNIGAINVTPNCTSGSWSIGAIDVSALPDNPTLSITADHDNDMGTPATQASATVNKDTTIPTVTITNPPDINVNNHTAYTVSGTCSENGQAVDISIGTQNYSPICSSGAWLSGPNNISSQPDNPSLLITADHQNGGGTPANQAIAYVDKSTTTPTVSGLSVPATYSSSLDLDWSLEDPGGFTIDDYIIQYREVGSPTWLTFDDGVSTETNATVTGLASSTNYEFQVSVMYDTTNQSVWSNVAEGETQPDNPIFTPLHSMNVGGATTSSVVAHEDDTDVLLNGVALVTLNAGENHVFTSTQYDIIEADKPIYTAGRKGSGGDNQKGNIVWNNAGWAGKTFSFNALRNNPQQLNVFAFENATIEVKQGGTVLASTTLTENTGGNLSWSQYGSYQIVSTGTILAFHYSGSGGIIVDPKPILPGHTELIGIPSREGRLTVLEDGTNYTILHSDSTTSNGSLNRNQYKYFAPQGTIGLFQEESVLITADKKISASSFADSNGYCATSFLPTNLMKHNYVINVASSYVAFASLEAGTIDVINNIGTVVETLTLARSGSDPNAPYKARRDTSSNAGYRFISTVPAAAFYHPSTDTGAAVNDETVLYGYDP
ncbi:fibronectin type III domain-containing protein [Bacteriovoracaceae bacterium]|nr:fibronectin type III domain-containing protein [Bacteriovoracaceae bacterium]